MRFFLPLSFRQKKAAKISSFLKQLNILIYPGTTCCAPTKTTADGKHHLEHAHRRQWEGRRLFKPLPNPLLQREGMFHGDIGASEGSSKSTK
jgi:hypothetical protein